MNKVAIVLTFCLAFQVMVSSCGRRIAPDERVTHRWEFVSITEDNGQTVRTISPGDYMEVRQDRTFHYLLYQEGIEADGHWEVREDQLHYTYDADGSVRTYKIEELSDTTLILEEHGVRYRFRR